MTCLFGGTFDPVHLGHTHAAAAVCDGLGLAQIHLVLSARPSHRGPTGATLEQRWDMLCLACEDEARLVADARELHRPGASYTVETLLAARAQNPTGPLYWVIGSDALVDLPAWHRWRELLELCHLVVLQRPDADARPAPAYPEQVQRLIDMAGTDAPPRGDFGSIYQLPRPMLAYSASAVRARIAQGAEVAHLLNPRVATYIREHGLYGAACDA